MSDLTDRIAREHTVDIAAIRERAQAATEGPWDAEDCEGELEVLAGSARTTWTTTESGYRVGTPAASYRATDLIAEWDLDTWDEGEDEDDDQRRANAEFIAAARTDVEALCDEVERLRALVDSSVTEAAVREQVAREIEAGAVAAPVHVDDSNSTVRLLMIPAHRAAQIARGD